MAFRNEAYEVQNLINIYRANPNMFDSDQLDVLQGKANQYGINFKPLKDTTSLSSLAKNFAGGFVRGMVPFVPPDEQPRTTYDAIAQSLGHLAGFAPSILAVPLGGLTKGLKAIGALDKKKYVKTIGGKKVETFIGQQGVAFLDKWSIPMMGSRTAKRAFGRGISKLELDTLDYMKAGGVGRAIGEEAIGLGTASAISNIWAGPDEYMNTFVGGALAGGVFGGIGNWRAIGNRLGVAKTEGQRTRAEDALKTAVGSAFQGLPATLRQEPVEMQLYEYLLGGFFGYKSRPAQEAAGGKFLTEIETISPDLIYKPESTPGFSGLSKKAQEYAIKQSTKQAEKALNDYSRQNGLDLNLEINRRLQYEPDANNPEVRNRELRKFAHEVDIRRRQDNVIEVENEQPVNNNTMDYMDSIESRTGSVANLGRLIHQEIGSTSKFTRPGQIINYLQNTMDKYVLDSNGVVRKSIDADSFVAELEANGAIGKWITKNKPEVYKMLAQNGKQNYETYVFDADAGTIDIEKSGLKQRLKFIGVNQFNSPIIDVFGEGKGFGFLPYIKSVKDGRVVYEDIFKYNPFAKQGEPSYNTTGQLGRIAIELAKKNSYIYAGIKDKSNLLTATFRDGGRTIEDIVRFAPKEAEALKRYYKESESLFIKDLGKGVKNAADLHRKQFVSNIIYELEHHGFTRNGVADLRQLPKIMSENYFKDAIDFNKRMQGYVEASGMPMHPNTFRKSIGSNEMRFMILREEDFTPSGRKGESEVDGGLFFRPQVFKDITRVMGLKTDNVKPVVMGRLLSPVNKGLVFLKTSGKNAQGQDAINKIIKDNNLDFVVFDQGNKIKGETRPTEFTYDAAKNEYALQGMPEVHKIAVESLRINPSTYENPNVNKGINLPRQFFITLNERQSPKTLRSFIDHYFKGLGGDKQTQELVKQFEETGNIQPIETFLKSSRYALDQLPFNFVIKQLGNPSKEGDVIRRALQRIDKENNTELESFAFDTNKQYTFFHESKNNLAGLNNGRYAGLTFHEKLSDSYTNAIRKYILRRTTTPYWKYGGKGVLNPVTKDVFADADMIKRRPLKEPTAEKGGEVLLDLSYKKMNVKVDLTPEQIKNLNAIKKGINENGESTLGHIWDLYKISKGLGTPEQANKLKVAGNDAIKRLDEALDLLAIRVPADSLSGIRNLRFVGFTKHKGAGITTHRTDDRYLGGADKDIDSAFIIQGGSRNHINEVRNVALERKDWDNTEIMSRFSTSSNLPTYSKFSPFHRLTAYAAGRKGAAQRGQAIAIRDALFEMYAQAKANKGVLDLGDGLKFKLKRKGIDKLLENVYGSINVNNDSTKYYSIAGVKEIQNRLYNDLFTAELNGKQIPMDSAAVSRNPIRQSISKFHSRYKTNPFNEIYKKYSDIESTVSDHGNQTFFGATGRQFKHALDIGIFENVRNLETSKNININLRRGIKDYTDNVAEKEFVKEFIGIANAPVKNLQALAGTKRVFDNISINLSKATSQELLIQNALKVYQGFSEVKRTNPKGIAKQLENVYGRARRVRKALMDSENRYYSEATKNTSINMPDLNNLIAKDKYALKKFIKDNKLKSDAANALYKFYDTVLLTPEAVPGAKEPTWRLLNPMYGSEQVSPAAKQEFFIKFNELYNRVPTEKDVIPKEFLQPITKEARDLVLHTDKVDSTINKIGKSLDKTFNMENYDFLIKEKGDRVDLKKLQDNLSKFPQIDSFNEFFIDFTKRSSNYLDARDVTMITMNDVKALNEYFKYGERGKGDFKWTNWLIDPRTIDARELQKTLKKYDSYITPVRTVSGIKQMKVARYTSPLGAIRDMIRLTLTQQNAATSQIQENNLKIFDWAKYGLTANDQYTVMRFISNKRNPEAENTITAKDEAFKTKKFKGKTGEEIIKEYDTKFTTFVNEMGKYIYTYDKKGNRIEFEKTIDIDNPKFGVLNEFLRFKKDGSMDLKRFEDTVLRPIVTGGKHKVVGIESLLRYQYETIMEGVLSKQGKSTLKDRIAYRKNKKFTDFAFGYIKPEQYFPRTNYGATRADRKLMYTDIERLVKEGKGKYEDLFLFTENTRKESARAEDNFLNIQYEFRDKNYKDVGYKNKPKNLLQRGEEFIQGYDRRPSVINKYSDQIARSYFNNLIAIYGNKQIELFKSQGGDLNKGITGKQLAALKKAGYENNTDVWSDFLYIYLKNSLGHPSLLTDRIQKSINKGDPLKLKRNPYYLTTDYSVTNALEKLYQTGKFNKMPMLRNAPEDPAARRDYLVRRLHELGVMEAKYNLLTLLANTGSMMTNLYGGATQTIGSASFKSFIDGKKNSVVTERLLKDQKGNFTLFFKNGNAVKNRKDLRKYFEEAGILDNYLQNELEYNKALSDAITGMGKQGKNFLRDIRAALKRGERNESMLEIAERYGVKDKMLRAGGFFMQFGERVNRFDAFVSHALKAQERLGPYASNTSLKDPFIFEAGLKGIETTQFLYHNAFRPAFMTTATGKVLSRFKLFAFQSVRTRKEFYKQAKAYGFKEGTPEYERFKDLFLTDLFGYAMAGAFMYSLFDTALPPPWDWMQDTADLLFGDKKERDRAFYGTLPRPIAPLQVALPPIARFPQTFVELIQGDWEKFSDYTVHTMYPFGRMVYAAKKTKERPERFVHNFFRLPTDKISYRIKREQIREARQERIDEFLDEG